MCRVRAVRGWLGIVPLAVWASIGGGCATQREERHCSESRGVPAEHEDTVFVSPHQIVFPAHTENDELWKRLNEPLDELPAENIRLDGFLFWIAQHAGCKLRVDWEQFATRISVKLNDPVKIPSESATARQLLDSELERVSNYRATGWEIWNGELVVTGESAPIDRMETQQFLVGDLLRSAANFRLRLRQATKEPEGLPDAYEMLAELLEGHVVPDQLRGGSGSMSMFGGFLILLGRADGLLRTLAQESG